MIASGLETDSHFKWDHLYESCTALFHPVLLLRFTGSNSRLISSEMQIAQSKAGKKSFCFAL